MSSSRNTIPTPYGGRTLSNHSSTQPSTTPSTNRSQAPGNYSIDRFLNGPASTPLPSTRSPQEIEAAHQARVAARLKALAARLP
ncbi:hypothetical protein F4679DRAFT_580827 [Xylaria curta]|nr:hypothetical protein F4679DRAFT_580827 [Xylaria curta]